MPSACGVDLSLVDCGLAFMRQDGTLRYVTTIKPAKHGALTQVQKRAIILKAVQRLYYLVKGFDVIIVEHTVAGPNIPLLSIEPLIGLTATIEDWAAKVGMKVVRVYPATWRKHILGNGRAKKKDAQAYVLERHGRDLGEDAAEAVCQAEYGVRGLWNVETKS